MAGKTINMNKVKQMLRLRSNDVPLQTIAKAVSLSRNTIKKYLQIIESRKLPFEDLLDLDDTPLEALLYDPDPKDISRYSSLFSMFPYIQKELLRTGVNRWLLWGEYKQKNPDGYNYPRFCEHNRQWKTSSSGTMHFEHEP